MLCVRGKNWVGGEAENGTEVAMVLQSLAIWCDASSSSCEVKSRTHCEYTAVLPSISMSLSPGAPTRT